jgi:AI-2 transport protein TqsA
MPSLTKRESISLTILATGAIIVFCYYAQSILIPVIAAIYIAYLFYPLAEFFDKLRFPKWINIILVVLLTFFIIFSFGYLFFKQVQLFLKDWTVYQERLSTLFNTWWFHLHSVLQSIDKTAPLTTAPSLSTSTAVTPEHPVSLARFFTDDQIFTYLPKVFIPISTLISTIVIVLVIAFFIIYTRVSLKQKLADLLGERNSVRTLDILREISSAVQNYILGRAIIMVFIASTTTIGLSIIGVKYAFLWGIVIALLNWIPFFGVLIATIMPVLVALVQFPTIWPAIWVVIIYTVIQLVDNLLLSPILLGDRVNLNPIIVLISFMFWTWLWGVMGAILAVPITATIKVICDQIESLKPVSIILSGGITQKIKQDKDSSK